MAMTFPLAVANFQDLLLPLSISFDLTDSDAHSETAGGEIVRVSSGVRLWEMAVTCKVRSWYATNQLAALIDMMRRPGASFLASPPHYVGPMADKTGATLGASTPTLTDVDANMRDIALAGLPAGYVLSRGDFVSFSYGGVCALHRLVAGVTANGSGVVAAVEVDPAIRTGWVDNASVQFLRPTAKFVMVPGSVTGAVWSGRTAAPLSFVARQTLR